LKCADRMSFWKTLPLWLTLFAAGLQVDAASRPDKAQDLAYGEILYDFFRQDYFSALTRLDIALQKQRLPHHLEEAELLRGGLLLSYGLYDESERIFNQLLKQDVDSKVRNQVWFHIARIRHRQGDALKAHDALNKLRDADLPLDLQDEARQLRGRVLMDLGHYDAAVELLGAPSRTDLWNAYTRFNLGVALIRAGEVVEGRAHLSILGDQDDLGTGHQATELLALRDKANLALGYIALREKQGDAAAQFLRKVSLNGMTAEPALLGLGWAEIADGHPSLALAPWDELSRKDITEPAVQESLLAIPYILIEAGDYAQAESRYRLAVDAFVAERQRLTNMAQQVRENSIGDLLLTVDGGQDWQPPSPPKAFRGAAWEKLFASNEFQSVLRNIRDLRFLAIKLDGWQSSMGAYDDMLALRRKAYEQRLPRVVDRLQHLDMTAAHKLRGGYAKRLQLAATGEAALPTGEELRLEAGLKKARDLLRRYRGDPSLDSQREKRRLLEGVYRWRLTVDQKARLWSLRKQLKALDQALANTEVRRQGLEDARQRANSGFDGYDDRIRHIAATVKALRRRVDRSIDHHERYLRTLILRSLDQQQVRLRSYEVQARFGLARIYDLAADRNGESQ